VRVIAKRMLREFWERHPVTRRALEDWHDRSEKADWKSPRSVRPTFGRADTMTIHGKNVIVFDILENRYRLITTVTYSTDGRMGVVYTREVLTHKEYDTNQWKTRIK
jgi:mRNA interferase HigB